MFWLPWDGRCASSRAMQRSKAASSRRTPKYERTITSAYSMPEVPVAGEDHRDAVFVARRDAVRVAHRPARLHDRHDARLGRLIDVVAEGEERVAGQHRTLLALARL